MSSGRAWVRSWAAKVSSNPDPAGDPGDGGRVGDERDRRERALAHGHRVHELDGEVRGVRRRRAVAEGDQPAAPVEPDGHGVARGGDPPGVLAERAGGARRRANAATASCTVSSGARSSFPAGGPARGHRDLAEGEAPVGAGHALVDQHPQPARLQPGADPLQQHRVEEDPAGQRGGGDAVLGGRDGGGAHRRVGEPVVEPRRDPADVDSGAQVLGAGGDQVPRRDHPADDATG